MAGMLAIRSGTTKHNIRPKKRKEKRTRRTVGK